MLESKGKEWQLIHNGKQIFILKLISTTEGVDQIYLDLDELLKLKEFLEELPITRDKSLDMP